MLEAARKGGDEVKGLMDLCRRRDEGRKGPTPNGQLW